MRFVWVVAVAAAFACGGTSSESLTGAGTGSAGTGGSSGSDGGTQTFAVTVKVSGSGAITASGQTCANSCALKVPAGALHLVAAPSAGWSFASWSAACSSAACDLTVSADLTLTATFTQNPPPPPVAHDLTVTVNGPGRLVSSPAGIDCPGACTATFEGGINVLFVAIPGTAAKFDGFSGACSGTACTVNLGTDVAVSGTFEAVVPIHHVLTVEITGTGSVSSTPMGLICPGACSVAFDEGTTVTLTPLNGSGFNFGGFSQACAGGGCTVTMMGDVTVGAAFIPKPDPCLGLMPAIPQGTNIPITVDPATILTCASGTSDGQGNLALTSTYDAPTSAGIFPLVGFYTPGGFGAPPSQTFGSSLSEPQVVLDQPNGFDVFLPMFSFSFPAELFTFSPLQTVNSVILSHGEQFPILDTVAAAADPAGGIGVVRNYPLSGSNFVTTWQEYDVTGAPASLELQIGSGRTPIEQVLFLPDGDALVVTGPSLSGNSARLGIWVNRGALLSNWFALGDQAVSLSVLSRNTLLLRAADGSPIGVATDQVAQLAPPPAWIAARFTATGPFPFHAGAAYAMFATPHCPQMEVLTSSGISCGCANVPGASRTSNVGRDGTIIAPSPTAGGTCSFAVYPQALR